MYKVFFLILKVMGILNDKSQKIINQVLSNSKTNLLSSHLGYLYKFQELNFGKGHAIN
jgi:hypothetical protein